MSDVKTALSLKYSEEKFKLLFEYSPVGMAMVSHETGEFLEINKALLDYTGYTKEEFLELSFWDITPEKYLEQENKQIEDLNKSGRFGPNEKEYIRKDGTLFPIRISGFIMTDVDGSKIVWGIIEDISLEKKTQEAMWHLAFSDALTGIPNRRLFDDHFEKIIGITSRNQKMMALIIFDFDCFKNINDTYGHYIGDEVLKYVAGRINKMFVRKEDTFARLGGDEFAVILPRITSMKQAVAAAQKILSVSEDPVEINHVSVSFTLSVGVAISPEHGTDTASLYKAADDALYHAKENGRNCYILAKGY